MNYLLKICTREFKSYFITPLFYISSILIYIFSGIFFTFFIYQFRIADMRFIWWIIFILALVLPLLSIKLISEEKNRGTIELLLTSPITPFQIVFGKYLAAILIWVIINAGMLIYPFFLIQFSSNGIDFGQFITAYLGLFLFGSSLIGIGLFCSSIASSPMIAAFLSEFIVLFLLFLHLVIREVDPLIGKIVSEISPINHIDDFLRGVLDIKHILYYFLWGSTCVLFANIFVSSHTWKK